MQLKATEPWCDWAAAFSMLELVFYNATCQGQTWWIVSFYYCHLKKLLFGERGRKSDDAVGGRRGENGSGHGLQNVRSIALHSFWGMPQYHCFVLPIWHFMNCSGGGGGVSHSSILRLNKHWGKERCLNDDEGRGRKREKSFQVREKTMQIETTEEAMAQPPWS